MCRSTTRHVLCPSVRLVSYLVGTCSKSRCFGPMSRGWGNEPFDRDASHSRPRYGSFGSLCENREKDTPGV